VAEVNHPAAAVVEWTSVDPGSELEEIAPVAPGLDGHVLHELAIDVEHVVGRAISSIGVSAVTVMVSWTLEICIWMSTLKVAPADQNALSAIGGEAGSSAVTEYSGVD
jgi:hypothetical protein